MKITLCYSMQFAEKAKEVQAWFKKNGHHSYPSKFIEEFIGLSDAEKERLKLYQKYKKDAIREHWELIQKCDAILVLNYEKHGIAGYIGGNAFLEMGFAYVLSKPIYLLNEIPQIPYYKTEIIAMKPILINNDFEKVIKNGL